MRIWFIKWNKAKERRSGEKNGTISGISRVQLSAVTFNPKRFQGIWIQQNKVSSLFRSNNSNVKSSNLRATLRAKFFQCIITKEKKILTNTKNTIQIETNHFTKTNIYQEAKKKKKKSIRMNWIKTTGFDNPIYEMIRNVYIFFQKNARAKKSNFFYQFLPNLSISTIISSRENFNNNFKILFQTIK